MKHRALQACKFPSALRSATATLAVGILSSASAFGTVTVDGSFTDRPEANETVLFKYTAALASVVNSVGNLPGFATTNPRSSQAGWRDPAGAALQGDARYWNPLYNNGDFKLEISYSTTPHHPVSHIAAIVHFTNGVADGATLGRGMNGNTGNTGVAAALKLSGIDQGRIATVGDPIQLATGAATAKRTLFKLSGAREWEFGLSYNSALASAQDVGGPVGFGWCHPFEARVLVSGSNRIVQFNYTQACTYSPKADEPGVFISTDDAGRHDRLAELPDGGWCLTRRDQMSRRFNSEGILVEDIDAHGRKLALSYDGSGRLSAIADVVSSSRLEFAYIFGTPRIGRIVDGMGGVVSLDYDPGLLLRQITNQNEKKNAFTYDERRELLTVTDDSGVVSIANTYDADGHVVAQDDGVPDNLPLRLSYVELGMPGCNVYAASDVGKSVPLPLSQPGSFAVDRFTRLDGKTIEYTYGETGLLSTAVVDGRATTLNYDPLGHVISVTDPDGETSPIVPRINVTAVNRVGESSTYEFDSDFNLLSTTNSLGQITRCSYDSQNNLVSITDALNRVTAFEYDAGGNVTEKIDPAGKITRHAYDARNNLLTTTDPAGNVTTLTYDEHNNPTSRVDALGQKTTWTYGSDSQLLTATSPRGGITRSDYVGGRLKQITDPAGVMMTFGFDSNGRLLERRDALGKGTSYKYDGLGNAVHVTNAQNETMSYTYDYRNRLTGVADPSGATTSYAYDGNGNLESITDPLGEVTTFTYDGEDRRISETDASGQTIVYGYDPAGRPSSIMDATGTITHLLSDAEGQLTSVTESSGARTDFGYDRRGLLTSVIDPLRRETVMGYDETGRKNSCEDGLRQRTKFDRDALGFVVQVTDPSGLISRQAINRDGDRESFGDPRSNSTKLDYDSAGRPNALTTPEGRKATVAYDSRGLLASVTEPSGKMTSYSYDDAERWLGRVDSMGEINVSRDACGRVTALSENGRTLRRCYDLLGRLTSCVDADGNSIGYDYDENGRVARLIYPDGRAVAYSYDAAGRMTTVTDWAGRRTAYGYDSQGRVVETVRPNGTNQVRTYDEAGQLVALRELARDGLTPIYSADYGYDAASQLTREKVTPEIDSPMTESVQTFDRDNRLLTHNGAPVAFDLDGNLLAVNSPTSPQSFVYDARNRLSRAGGLAYEYDTAGRRVRVVGPTGLVQFVVSPGEVLDQVLVRISPDGTKTNYVHGLGLLHEETGNSTRYYHCDRRGDTVALTDADGAVTDRMAYGPYGELVSKSGNTDTPFLFNGRWGVQTDANGLTYHRARYYHPGLRRFLNQDTMLGSVAVPATLNRYAYTRGNPVGFIDPTGYYDADVHHDLTFNLAVRAGFSRADAEKIAAADQGVDDNETTSPYSSLEARRDFHFTTPERRERMLQNANDAHDLSLFGQYLHAEQDSYSHQHGQTDRNGEPYGPRLGHLLAGHGPDRTSERPELAVKMADTTYHQLRKFYDRTHSDKPCDDWENIRPNVEEWVRIPR